MIVKLHTGFNAEIEGVQATVKKLKQLKNGYLPRNITEYRPVMFNYTRWSGKHHTLK